MEKEKILELIDMAIENLDKAYVPYSHFHVSACLLTDSGKIYTGTNIENSAYSLTVCAERTAIFKAVSEGERNIKAICIVGGKDGKIEDYTPPCGSCRQVMREFSNPQEMEIILAKSRDEYIVNTLEEMLPLSFGPENLRDN